MSGRMDDSCVRLRPPSETLLGNAGPQVIHVSGKIDDLCAKLRPPSETSLGNAGPQVTHVSGKIEDSCARIRPPSEKPLSISDGLCARPRPPGRRRRSQRWIPNTATHVTSQLTEQDPRTMAGAVVIDCRPAVLPVSVNVSGIDMQTVRHAEPPAEPPAELVIAPTEREEESTTPMWLNDIDPELEVTPLLDSGTDCQDELSSPDGSPMVISPIAGLLPSQGEDDINLARILAEFSNLPAFVSPIMDKYAEGEMPPTEYHPPELPSDLFVMPVGPGDGGSLTRDLTVLTFPPGNASPAPEGMSGFPLHTWRSPPSEEKSTKFRLQPPETMVFQSEDNTNKLRECATGPDVSREGPFNVHRVMHRPDTPTSFASGRAGMPLSYHFI